ncbi:signal recognition particle-docking protein FtsY [Marinovum sp.]|uniref:signal recognition particle-docking protein FtsY n=1 Tax=Marinovum sp. TaxID=2024839 RepID=UPI003A913630
MSFFGKLKDRLLKSSSKLDQGLEAIVEEGGEIAAADPDVTPGPDTAPEPAPEVVPEPDPTPTPEPETVPAPEPEKVPEPETVPSPDPVPHPQPDVTPTPAPTEVPQPDLPQGVPGPAETPQEMPGTTSPVELPIPETPAEVPTRKPGLLGRLLRRGAEPEVLRRTLDDEMIEQLEELLIASDMGVDTALRVTANMAEGRYGRKLSVNEIKQLLSREIARVMEPVARPLPLYAKKPQVVLVVGVNGSGKTTTIGKLASQFRAAGKSVVIAAGDTFRAAAVEQLQVWGDRAGVPVLTAPEGSDPASLAFDAMEQAARDGADLLIIDTAGRLQNRKDLMEELSKIVRVIRKKDPDAPHNTLLVLDATTGQNALSQVKTFQELANVTGLVMTKLDGTAKGGVLVALADKFGLPIHAIGVGEKIDDLAPFDPEDFAAALTGLDR